MNIVRLSTNLDLRAYAAAHDITLGSVARRMGISPSAFSIQYMREEQTRKTKERIKKIIRDMSEERKG